jgi:NAD-dependent SIR2 family protein deacetylase
MHRDAAIVWRCVNCRGSFDRRETSASLSNDIAPSCPSCQAGNEYVRRATPLELLSRIRPYRYRCAGGRLADNLHWRALKKQLEELDRELLARITGRDRR